MIRFFKDKRGTGTAEAAVMFLIYFYIVFMGITFSNAYWAKIVIYDSAREGARYQALGYGPATTKVNEVLVDGLLKTANVQSINAVEGANYVTVTVEYNQPSLLPLVPVLLGDSPLSNTFLIKGAALFKKET